MMVLMLCTFLVLAVERAISELHARADGGGVSEVEWRRHELGGRGETVMPSMAGRPLE